MRVVTVALLGFVAVTFQLGAGEAPADGSPFPMPEARYDTRIEKSLLVPMRDGVRLSTDVYLRSGGGANSLDGDGALSTEPPKREPADRITYDPASPVPSLSGAYGMEPP